MLADSANDDPSRYIELLTTRTNEAGRSWDRPTEEAPSAEQGNQAGHAELPGVSADETEDATTGSDLHSAASSIERVERFHQRLGRAAATLSALRQSEAKRIQPVSTDREQSVKQGYRRPARSSTVARKIGGAGSNPMSPNASGQGSGVMSGPVVWPRIVVSRSPSTGLPPSTTSAVLGVTGPLCRNLTGSSASVER